MQIVRLASSWYWPWPGRRAVLYLVVVLVLVLGVTAGYGEVIMGALATAVVTVVLTEIVQASLRG